MALPLRFFATAAGRSQPLDFLGALAEPLRAQIVADLEAYRIHRLDAPISCKMIKGHRPMFEIRTGAFRTYCVVKAQTVWVLHVGQKQTQRRDIEAAAKRMEAILSG